MAHTETYLKNVALKHMPPNLQKVDLLKAGKRSSAHILRGQGRVSSSFLFLRYRKLSTEGRSKRGEERVWLTEERTDSRSGHCRVVARFSQRVWSPEAVTADRQNHLTSRQVHSAQHPSTICCWSVEGRACCLCLQGQTVHRADSRMQEARKRCGSPLPLVRAPHLLGELPLVRQERAGLSVRPGQLSLSPLSLASATSALRQRAGPWLEDSLLCLSMASWYSCQTGSDSSPEAGPHRLSSVC